VLKSTKVDGVYDKDPTKFADAKKFATLSYQQAVENPAIAVMDKAAMGLAMEQHMPLIIFELDKDDILINVVKGQPFGTKIS
jgi:uridylate kinase